jgi:predicted O-methyltransferase YrrM
VTKKAQRMLAVMDRATTLWHIPNVGRAKGRVIRRLIDRHRPTRALEIGSLLGYSAILIAGGLPPGGRLTCIEANDYLAKFVKANAEEAGLGRRVKVVVGDALRATPARRTTSTTCASSSPSWAPARSSSPTTPASSAVT